MVVSMTDFRLTSEPPDGTELRKGCVAFRGQLINSLAITLFKSRNNTARSAMPAICNPHHTSVFMLRKFVAHPYVTTNPFCINFR